MSPSVSGANTRYMFRVTVGLLCPSHEETAFSFSPDCSQWWVQVVAGLPLTPVPVATDSNPAFAIPPVIQRAAVLRDSGRPPRPTKTLSFGARLGSSFGMIVRVRIFAHGIVSPTSSNVAL